MGIDTTIYVEFKQDSGDWRCVEKVFTPRFIDNEIEGVKNLSKFIQINWNEFVELNPSKEVYDAINISCSEIYYLDVSPSIRLFLNSM